MKRGISVLLVLVLAYLGAQIYALSASLERVRSDDPTVWGEDIAAFASKAPGPSGALLFVGSSSIRRWVDLAEHMAPIPVINRGFGGSKIGDVIYHAETLFQARAPRALRSVHLWGVGHGVSRRLLQFVAVWPRSVHSGQLGRAAAAPSERQVAPGLLGQRGTVPSPPV